MYAVPLRAAKAGVVLVLIAEFSGPAFQALPSETWLPAPPTKILESPSQPL
jgi:hypothetical protein